MAPTPPQSNCPNTPIVEKVGPLRPRKRVRKYQPERDSEWAHCVMIVRVQVQDLANLLGDFGQMNYPVDFGRPNTKKVHRGMKQFSLTVLTEAPQQLHV